MSQAHDSSYIDNDRIDNSNEDIWGDDDDMTSTTTAEIKRIHTKQGYLDGLSNAKESSLQSGFDDGYPKGGQLGVLVGCILSTILSYKPELFDTCKKELAISNVLSRGHFNDDLEIEDVDKHEVLRKWKDICEQVSSND